MVIPQPIRNLYRRIAHPHGRVHDTNIRDTYWNKGGQGFGDWIAPNWYFDIARSDASYRRKPGNLGFLQEHQKYSGNLADTMPFFANATTSGNNFSEELTVSNGLISFSVTLGKQGEYFSYEVWRENSSVALAPPFIIYPEKLSDEEREVKYPWYNDRLVTKVTGKQWIQREEFKARFVQPNPKTGAPHPLKSTSAWNTSDGAGLEFDNESETWFRSGNIGSQVFADLHYNFYEREVMESVIGPLRRGPMENFWLEEYYTADCYSEDENVDGMGITLRSIEKASLKRNRVFDKNDTYFKMGDIRQVAREILEDKD